jgi:hypothetical protein
MKNRLSITRAPIVVSALTQRLAPASSPAGMIKHEKLW